MWPVKRTNRSIRRSCPKLLRPGRIHLVAWLTAGCIQAAGGGCLEREEGSSVTVSAQVGLGSYIRFTIADPKEGETLPYVNLSFENQNMEDGKVYISRMSDGGFSGTFEGGRITEGRFDLKYKE